MQVYQRGCTLANHVDRAGTHIISAIINVAQKVWLLQRTALCHCS